MNHPVDPREAVLLAMVLERAPERRAAFLEAVCQGDPLLRARLEAGLEAGALVSGESGEGRRAGDTWGGAGGSLRLDPAGRPVEEDLGQTLGRYKLLERLGEGGCGVVYVAEQAEPVRRRVALKIIKLGMDTKAVVARFEMERQALALMDHPCIARVLDAGTTETGRPFFVMELVRGIPITEYCGRHRLDLGARLELFIKVCQAIQHAHQKGIVHRDIKPTNILVGLHDGVPVPKVIDFGIAKAIEGRLTDSTVYTQMHHFVGTPAYMSPEQAEMSGLDIDTRSDIYSLGVLLYEVLTGRTPFDARNLVASGLEELRRTLREEEPLRPSVRLKEPPRAEGTEGGIGERGVLSIPDDLDWIVMKCLEKDRTRRYETANGLAADLRRHLASEPVVARPPTGWYRLGKALRRHRLAFVAAGGVVVALAAGLAASVGQAVRATRAEALASSRAAEAESIATFLTDVFQSPDPARDGRAITVAETLDMAVKRLDTDLVRQPERKAQMQATLGQTYLALGLPAEAIPLLAAAREFRASTSGPSDRGTLAVGYQLASAQLGAGKVAEAIARFEELERVQRELDGPENPETLRIRQGLATAYSRAGRHEEALRLREEGLQLSRKVNGSEHPATLSAMHNLAVSLSVPAGLAMREEVLALRRKLNGPSHPDTFRAAYNLELTYAAMGRHADSLRLLEELVPMSRGVVGADHRITQQLLGKLERAYFDAGRREDALRLRADHERWNPRDINTDLAVFQLWFGQRAEYVDTCARLLKFAEGTSEPTTAERVAKACLLVQPGDPAHLERATTLARRALELGPNHAYEAWFHYALGVAEYRRGRFAEADRELTLAMPMAGAHARFFRAMSLHRQGKTAEAHAMFHDGVGLMRPFPDDPKLPFAGGGSGNDLIAWLAYLEAKALLGITTPDVPSVSMWLARLREEIARRPEDSIAPMQLAFILAWQGRDAEHAEVCETMLALAERQTSAMVHDRAAKSCLITSKAGPELTRRGSQAAQRALSLVKPGDANLPWFKTVAGMGHFREGRWTEAESRLREALAEPLHENQRLLALAFLAMTRWEMGLRDEARANLVEVLRTCPPAPDPERVSATLRDQDRLAVRLAAEEAQRRIGATTPPSPVGGWQGG